MPQAARIITAVSLVLAVAGCGQGEEALVIPDLGEPEPVALAVRWERIVACLARLGFDAEVTDDGVGMITDPLPPEETADRDRAIEACSERYPQLPPPPPPQGPSAPPAPSAAETPTEG